MYKSELFLTLTNKVVQFVHFEIHLFAIIDKEITAYTFQRLTDNIMYVTQWHAMSHSDIHSWVIV